MSEPQALVIEDNVDAAMIFSAAIKAAGYDVEVISDGLVAEERLKQLTPRIIMLDLHLPNVSGGELLNQIRLNDRLQKTRVILATADNSFAKSLHSEADLILIKPISFNQLRLLAMRFLGDD